MEALRTAVFLCSSFFLCCTSVDRGYPDDIRLTREQCVNLLLLIRQVPQQAVEPANKHDYTDSGKHHYIRVFQILCVFPYSQHDTYHARQTNTEIVILTLLPQLAQVLAHIALPLYQTSVLAVSILKAQSIATRISRRPRPDFVLERSDPECARVVDAVVELYAMVP